MKDRDDVIGQAVDNRPYKAASFPWRIIPFIINRDSKGIYPFGGIPKGRALGWQDSQGRSPWARRKEIEHAQ